MLTEHFSGDPEDMAALYRGEHGFTECRGNPLPRSDEWYRAEADKMVHPDAAARDAYVDDHYRALKTIDAALCRAMRRPANDNRGRVR